MYIILTYIDVSVYVYMYIYIYTHTYVKQKRNNICIYTIYTYVYIYIYIWVRLTMRPFLMPLWPKCFWSAQTGLHTPGAWASYVSSIDSVSTIC